MIIQGLFTVILSLFDFITSMVSIPPLPDELMEVFMQGFEFIGAGIAVLSNYVHLSYLLSLFGIVAFIEIGLIMYKVGMFIARKIPALGIS